MFYHGYKSYLKYSFPKDELKPISCTGSNTFGDYALTFIDSLDTLVVMGDMKEFERGINWVIENINFNNDITVSVFETNIRVLGGLLSSHLIAEEHLGKEKYSGKLLDLAIDLGDRLLRAFQTPTGIPYGTVNLKHGVPMGETPITSTASSTTFSLEFGILSILSNDPKYEEAARRAVRSIWLYRSDIELLGNHINIFTGEWTIRESGIGTGIDSFYEYLYKAAIFFDDEEYMDLFFKNYQLINKYIKKDPWYVDVSIDRGAIVWPIYNSLQSFWPGVQSMYGDYESAFSTIKSFHIVWRRYGFIPEGYNLLSGNVQLNQKGYPLRPELAESLYHMYQTTKDPIFVRMGKDLVWTLNNLTTTKCGHANVLDVETHQLDDRMESFFLSETCKYLFLLFNTEDNFNNNFNNSNPNPIDMESIIFNTEGHIFPMQYRFFKKSNNLLKNNNQDENLKKIDSTKIQNNVNNNNNNNENSQNNKKNKNNGENSKEDIIENNIENSQNKNNNNNQNNKNIDNNNKNIDNDDNNILDNSDNVLDGDNNNISNNINNKNKSKNKSKNKNKTNKLDGLEDSEIQLLPGSKKYNWTCNQLPFLRRISSGTFQFIGGPHDTEWFEDKKIKEAMHDLSS
ncbi:hypothetical protein DICPUDRAFT_91147 [Dictyostelium purpureum]|uniref:alpha-1,2-Mannosidase n=1 Tax=Dictyostelium purpureum TaxID=5786 RepID=F0Z8C2_DICPU|nr:uncharacterized protein DICPUDRAFT_91147 [Dictyostelium purpureum]EGC39812.1 hypothetical protein DICPUDRAFT_91147 [Dictyostelium purpureum]|eukprot:XP_003283679.1 hypothetical protein DICPUDRAFT_91147 [Dictyostelium purpureum]